MPWRVLATLVAAVTLASCAARTSTITHASGHRGRQPNQVIADIAPCQKTDRAKPVSDAAGARDTLVPGHPDTVQLCRYSGLNGHPPLMLLRTRVVTNAATVARLARGLDALPKPSTGTINCPADFGDAVIAVFGYRTGLPDPVTVALSGCGAVGNGHLTRLAGPAKSPVTAQLEQLTRR
jgi:hypothetical protein